MRFGDLSLKWNMKFNDNNRLYLTLINSYDALANSGYLSGNPNRVGLNWGNFAATLRWKPPLWAALVFQLHYLHRQFLITSYFSTTDAWASGIAKLSFKSDFTYYNNPRLTTRFGFELHGYNVNPGEIALGELVHIFPTIQQDYSRHNVLYYNATLKPNPHWRFKAGLRFHTWEKPGPC